MPEIARMYRYPLKGGGREYIKPSKTEPGMVVDRFGGVMDHRFALIDKTSKKILDQKTLPGLATIQSGYTLGADSVQISFRDGFQSGVAIPIHTDGRRLDLESYGELIPARIVDYPDAQEIINAYFKADGALLVVQFDESRGDDRGIDPDYAELIGNFGRCAFQGGSTFHVLSDKTVSAISERSVEAGLPEVDAERWRPTIIIETDKAFEEDNWVGKRVKVGDVVLRVYRKTPRCPIPGINQSTGLRDVDTRELYRSINRNLPAEHSGKLKPMVGVYASHENVGIISPNDEITILGDII